MMTKTTEKYLPFFVYGTLMEGFRNFEMFLKEFSPKIKEARLNDHTLLSPSPQAPFPYMAHTHDVIGFAKHAVPSVVYGQLMTVREKDFAKVLAELDWLEGVDRDHYARKEVTVWAGLNNVPVQAWVYYLPSKHVPQLFYDPIVPSGSWKKHTS